MSDAAMAMHGSMATLQQFNVFLSEHVGLHFPSARLADLDGGMQSLSARLGQPDAETCMRWLMANPLAQDKVEAIAAALTVGETHFFRDQDSLQAIEQQVLPELVRARQAERRLRIWSAGCSTGEEAYTLAIMIDRMGEALRGWQVTILATDIHAGSLKRAAEATYGEWSFRGVDAAVRAMYFRPAGERRHALIPRIRDRVQFRHLNLADGGYPSLLSNTAGMDLILCRNVLMYFAPDACALAIARLTDALADNAYLVTGASETLLARDPRLVPVRMGTTTLLCRSPSARGGAAAVAVAPPAAPATRGERPPAMAVPVPGAAVRLAPAPGEADLLARARALADAGCLDGALRLCAQAVLADKLDPAAHYLYALVLAEAGRTTQAERCLRGAIYLEPDFVMAHVALAGVLLARGRIVETRRHLAIARGLLRTHDAAQSVPLAEGLLGAQVLRMLEGMQEQADA